MKILAVCTGRAQPSDAKSGRTGYFKIPQSGQVEITESGLASDFIGDLEHHGGVDQAVYLFGETDRTDWENRLNRSCPPGFFGENLLISDLKSTDLCLGDILTVGTTQLQITSPRIPCATYASVIGEKTALKDFYDAQMPGAYARVLTGGHVKAGDPVAIVPWAGTRISVVENMAAYHRNFPDLSFLERALTVPAHYKLHIEAKKRLSLA